MIRIGNSKTKVLACVLSALTILCFAGFTITALSPNDSDKYINEQWYLKSKNESLDKVLNAKNCRQNKELISSIAHIRKGNQPLKKEETVVAVIDTLVDWSHEDLNGKSWINPKEIPNDSRDNDKNGYVDDYYGYDFLKMQGISTLKSKNPGSHGTAITGIICSNMNNKVGIAGITGGANVKVMNLVVLDSITTQGNVSNLITAIKYAEDNGAKLCNISSNYSEDSAELMETIKQSEMLFIVSAGNRPTLGVSLDKVVNVPSNYNLDNVLTVSAYTKDYRILRQANYGPKTVDILAPGDEILAPLTDDQYGYFSGTSIATPIVTGIAALLDQNTVEISASDLKKQILSLASYNDEYKTKIKGGAFLQLSEIVFR